jgi:hypothetical protein
MRHPPTLYFSGKVGLRADGEEYSRLRPALISIQISNRFVSGVPGNVAGTQYLTSVFPQTAELSERSLEEDLFPSADKRSSFARSPAATILQHRNCA